MRSIPTAAPRYAGRPGSGLHPIAGGGSLRPSTATLPARTLIVGLPRSGTSWLGEILAAAPGTRLVFEPENPDLDIWAPSAIGSSRGFEPVLTPADSAPLYGLLWEHAFLGGAPNVDRKNWPRSLVRLARAIRPVGAQLTASAPWIGSAVWRARVRWRRAHPETGHVIVKTVVASMSVEWILDRFQPQVLVIHREPLDMIASWIQMSFAPRPTPGDPLIGARITSDPRIPVLDPAASLIERVAWGVGVRKLALQEATARHPDWIVVRHEELVDDPLGLFPVLFERLGLVWTADAEHRLVSSDAPGAGYQTARRWSDLRRARSKRLSEAEAAAARTVLNSFPGDLMESPPTNLMIRSRT